MLLSIFICTDVKENVCLSYVPLSEMMTYQDAGNLLTAAVTVFAVAYAFRLMFRLFNI